MFNLSSSSGVMSMSKKAMDPSSSASSHVKRITFSSDLEEAMTESGKSLSNSKKYCSLLEKILGIYDVKQNEKHPFI